MPTYTYECKDCGTPYQKVRGISEPEPTYTCENCNLPLIRVYSNVGVTFNGSGFYRTDNRGK